MISRSVWREAQEIFERLIAVPEGERQEFLERAGTDRPEVSAAVARLIAADDRTRHWFDSAPVTALRGALEDEMGQRWIGRSLGAYRILEKIGHGGMGQVFLAEREDQVFDKRVAVKIMSASSGSALERFHRERQILADLDHPGIARLLDGGTTTDGLPYVVMEHVDGLPLDVHCQVRLQAFDARLELFLDICDAVQFAHRNLVVHRDLKPSNVLVEASGKPKLLDFGIAKLLESPEAGEARTEAADRVLTPDYASPEQIAGLAITTASDVYSLGVVLYEMLTGERPFRRGAGAREVREAEVPELPSTRAARAPSDAARRTDKTSASLARSLRGDLDNIILKALRPDPGERYPSVEGLAADIRNYRAGLPVEARAPNLIYRTRKFVGRHALAVALASASLLLLIGFSVVTAVQSQRIQAERDLAQQALGFLVDAFKSADPQETLGREVTAQDILERGAQRLGADSDLPDELQGVLMRTLGQVHISLGENEKGRDWLEQAVTVDERLHGSDDPRLGEELVELAEAYLFTVEYEKAEATALRALRLIGTGRTGPRVRALRAQAEAAAGLGRWKESAALHEDALALARRELGSEAPEFFDCLVPTARRLRSVRQVERARQLTDEGLEYLRRNRPGDHPETAGLLVFSGRLRMDSDDSETARSDLQAGLEMKLRIYGEEHPTVASSYTYLAQLEKRDGNIELSAELSQKSLAIYEVTWGGDHPMAVGARLNYAELVHFQLGDPVRAEPSYRRAVTDFAATEGSNRNPNMGHLLNAHGRVLNDLRRFDQAEESWTQARSLWVRREEGNSRSGLKALLGLAAAVEGQGDLDRARGILEDCWSVARESRGLDDQVTRQAGEELAAIYIRLGRGRDAEDVEQTLAAE